MYKNKNWVCFPQVSAPLSVPGQAAARSSPDRTSSPVTIARTQAKSASTVRCVTSASWGATTWRNTPGDIQAFIPACSRAPARPREGVAPCPCPPLILETEAPPGCETHPHTVHVHTKVHTAHTEAYTDIHTRVWRLYLFYKSCRARQPARPQFRVYYTCKRSKHDKSDCNHTRTSPLIPWGDCYLLRVISGKFSSSSTLLSVVKNNFIFSWKNLPSKWKPCTHKVFEKHCMSSLCIADFPCKWREWEERKSLYS